MPPAPPRANASVQNFGLFMSIGSLPLATAAACSDTAPAAMLRTVKASPRATRFSTGPSVNTRIRWVVMPKELS